ncbi:translation initiation factor IF-2-like isoform X1 [Corvus cornix cornix]|uniref:translation initiation factor IF-2-like isoform X1 n=1 Tax=Corvus cornix cornix TaxID=932674 RepID=UPI00195287FF|nr:translation initiation factor IF-2-like isoform X1 [Corvus cornix cornix]
MEPWPRWAVGWGSTVAPRAPPGPRPPPEPGSSGCWPGLSAVRAREARVGRRERPAKGLSPRQPFPPGALSSWQRTGAERPGTCTEPLSTWTTRRSLCERQPSGSLVSHEPGASRCPATARPQPRLLPRQRDPGPGPWSPACPRGRCGPLAAVPLGVRIRQGPELSPAGGMRASGHGAGSAAVRELCLWGRDRLCVPRDRRAALKKALGSFLLHLPLNI